MRSYNHGPSWRRPLWVQFALTRFDSRDSAELGCWVTVGLSVVALVASLLNWIPWWFFLWIIIYGLWVSMAVWWVDRYDRWDDDRRADQE